MDRNRFLSKIRTSIDPASLTADLVLILYSEFFLYGFLARGGWLVRGMSLDVLLLFGIALEFFLIWQIGLIAVSWFGGEGRYAGKRWFYPVVLAAGLLSLWVVFALHLTVFFSAFDALGKSDFFEALIRFFPYGVAALFVGIAGGVVQGVLEFRRRDGRDVRAYRLRLASLLSLYGLPLLMLYAGTRITGSLPAGLVLTGLFTAALVLLFRFLRTRARAAEERHPEAHRWFYGLVFPLIVFTLLSIWTEMLLLARINDSLTAKEPLTRAGLLLYLLLTGVVPMRILLAFRPPFRPVSLLSGAVAVWVFLRAALGIIG